MQLRTGASIHALRSRQMEFHLPYPSQYILIYASSISSPSLAFRHFLVRLCFCLQVHLCFICFKSPWRNEPGLASNANTRQAEECHTSCQCHLQYGNSKRLQRAISHAATCFQDNVVDAGSGADGPEGPGDQEETTASSLFFLELELMLGRAMLPLPFLVIRAEPWHRAISDKLGHHWAQLNGV